MLRLRSVNTVDIYGAMTSNKYRLVLVMELLVGGSLKTFLSSERRLPDAHSRSIIGDICNGMRFLHGKGAVHGDLKSANVLLDGDGRAKVKHTPYVTIIDGKDSHSCAPRKQLT